MCKDKDTELIKKYEKYEQKFQTKFKTYIYEKLI